MSAANTELSRRFTELFSTDDEPLAEEVLAPVAAILREQYLPRAMSVST